MEIRPPDKPLLTLKTTWLSPLNISLKKRLNMTSVILSKSNIGQRKVSYFVKTRNQPRFKLTCSTLFDLIYC